MNKIKDQTKLHLDIDGTYKTRGSTYFFKESGQGVKVEEGPNAGYWVMKESYELANIAKPKIIIKKIFNMLCEGKKAFLEYKGRDEIKEVLKTIKSTPEEELTEEGIEKILEGVIVTQEEMLAINKEVQKVKDRIKIIPVIEINKYDLEGKLISVKSEKNNQAYQTEIYKNFQALYNSVKQSKIEKPTDEQLSLKAYRG